MQAASECHIYFSFIWPYAFGNCGKEGKNYKKLNISRTKRAFQMKWKAFFITLEMLSYGKL